MNNPPALFNTLNLDQEQLDAIAVYSSLHYDLDQVAMLLDIDSEQFKKAYNKSGSAVKYYWDKGKLESQFNIQEKLMENAKAGNITAAQEVNKAIDKSEFQQHKKRIFFHE